MGFGCTIRFRVPENDKGIQTSQRIDVDAGTRSKAREEAAFMPYGFIRNHGLWINLKDAGLIPNLDRSINQLQELYQKKYLDEAPKYEFEQWQGDEWNCDCVCGGVNGYGRGLGKTQAKKRAAYMALIRLLQSAGICEKSREEHGHILRQVTGYRDWIQDSLSEWHLRSGRRKCFEYRLMIAGRKFGNHLYLKRMVISVVLPQQVGLILCFRIRSLR